MGHSVELFTIDDFPSYGRHAEEIVAELNAVLKESSEKSPSDAYLINHLKKDMLHNPDVYLSETMYAKLCLRNNGVSNAQCALK